MADITITRLGEDLFYVVTGSGFIGNDLAWIKMNTPPSDPPVEIRDETMEWACLPLWGPKARQVLQKITRDDVSNEAFPYLAAPFIDISGIPVWAQRVSYIGEFGWELYVPWERSILVWDRIMEAGQEFGIETGGYKVAGCTPPGKGLPLLHRRCDSAGKSLLRRA